MNKVLSKLTKKLDTSDIKKICILKDTQWNFGIKSQLKWFKENIKPNDVHILLEIDNNLIEPYNSIYMRTEDKNDNMDYFNSHKNKIDEIIKNSDRLFACSNGLNFKNYVRNFENVITIKLPEEEKYGAHLQHTYSLFNNMDLVHERTKYTIFEMLIISESKKIDAFCIFGRESNFLFLSAVNKTVTNYII